MTWLRGRWLFARCEFRARAIGSRRSSKYELLTANYAKAKPRRRARRVLLRRDLLCELCGSFASLAVKIFPCHSSSELMEAAAKPAVLLATRIPCWDPAVLPAAKFSASVKPAHGTRSLPQFTNPAFKQECLPDKLPEPALE